MAQNLKNMTPLVLLVLVTLVSTSTLADHPLKETTMSFYLPDFTAGPIINTLPIAGIAGKLWTFTQFGTFYVSDDPVTETPDPKAAPIGRTQGIYVIAGLDGSRAHYAGSIVFTSKQYNGSTLEFQGSYSQLVNVTEISVISGTGKFRLARGYAMFELYFYDASKGFSITRCNVTIRHY